jgi:DNA-binding transcriptional ArsR family regulator
MHGDAMNASERRGQRRLASLAVPSRFAIARCLLGGPRCVTELARAVGLSQSCTTRHLQALASVGLVSRARAGKRVNFELRAEDPAAAELLRAALGLEVAVEPAGGGTASARVPSARRVKPRPVQSAMRVEPAVTVADPELEPEAEPEREQRPAPASDLEDYLL